MVTVVYRVVTREGKQDKFRTVALKCAECARESKDCLYYMFFQSLTNPREFIVYYRFRNRGAQDKHIENLHKKIGPARGKRDLPEKFHELVEEEEVVLFKLK